METAPEPAPASHDAEPGEQGAVAPGGRPRSAGERGRLRLPPSGPAHAPLLLGVDAAGGEHPQGPGEADDETLVGRVWGCGCGWRGTVRDVATRHFRPRVGDGGGLRRKRLARADRDARPELDAHLAAATAAAPSGAPAQAPAALPPRATAGPERSRGLRRRLTLPRTTPVGDIPLGDRSAPGSAPAAPTHPGESRPVDPSPSPAQPPAASRPGDEQEHRAPAEGPTGDSTTETAVADLEQHTAGRPDPDPTRPPAPGTARTPPAPGPVGDALAAAATRAHTARAELTAAETALDAAVAAARADGASWRTIARATGVAHRAAAARWGEDSDGPSL